MAAGDRIDQINVPLDERAESAVVAVTCVAGQEIRVTHP
jgi:hypothetical protein